MACFVACVGQSLRQLKLTTATGDRRVAARIADELEEAGRGRRTPDQIKGFLGTVTDLVARRAAQRAFEATLRKTSGKGLDTQTTRGFIERWLARTKGEVSTATFARYDQTMRLLLESLGGKAEEDMALASRDDLARFRDAQAARVAPSTANLMLKIARLVFAAAEADGVVVRNEAKHVKRVRERANRVRRRAFTIEEIKRIVAVCDAEWRSMVLFGLYTGARLGDLALLTWQGVDLARNEVRFVTRKTDRQMIVPLARPLREHIERLPAGDNPRQPVHPRAWATVEREGRTGTLSRQFGDILAEAGLLPARSHQAAATAGRGKGRDTRRAVSEISFHALRHSMVSFLKTAGVSAAVAMDLAGHDSPEMSAHYTHLDDQTKLDALNKLPVWDTTKARKDR